MQHDYTLMSWLIHLRWVYSWRNVCRSWWT